MKLNLYYLYTIPNDRATFWIQENCSDNHFFCCRIYVANYVVDAAFHIHRN